MLWFLQSNSSTDSADSLPFANDNAGTIKQRASSRTHSGLSLLDSPRSSPLSSPALRRKDGLNIYRQTNTTSTASNNTDTSSPAHNVSNNSNNTMNSANKNNPR